MKTIYEKQIRWYHIIWYSFTHSFSECEAYDNAIQYATAEGLKHEVMHAILFGKYTPAEALYEWDI